MTVSSFPRGYTPADVALLAELDRITVTGSRIQRAGFDTLEPAAVIPRKSIDAYAHTNSGGSIDLHPSITAGTNYRGNQASVGARVNFLSRFGLDSNRMLPMVNGRRYVTSTPPTIFGAGGGSGVQVDLNAIPSMVVEQVDTINSGGASTYGSDAISGTAKETLKNSEFPASHGWFARNQIRKYLIWREPIRTCAGLATV